MFLGDESTATIDFVRVDNTAPEGGNPIATSTSPAVVAQCVAYLTGHKLADLFKKLRPCSLQLCHYYRGSG